MLKAIILGISNSPTKLPLFPEVIMNKIRSSGFHIAAQKETVLTKELAEQFYLEHKDKEFFGELTDFMTSGIKQI